MMKDFILYVEISLSIRKKVVFFKMSFAYYLFIFLTTWPVGLARD